MIASHFMELSSENQRILLNLARQSIRDALAGKFRVVVPEDVDPELLQPAGCFVTLHQTGSHQLRGCIGRTQSVDPLMRTVQETAAGALQDPRFENWRITPADLGALEIDISILSPLSPAKDVLDFEPQEDGIHLVFGQKSGLFLPQVGRETGWTREQLLERLCMEKLGLSPLIWRNPHAKLFRFSTMIIGPEPFQAGSLKAAESR